MAVQVRAAASAALRVRQTPRCIVVLVTHVDRRAALPLIAERLREVRHIILVLSGKGGVGKSTVATQLASSLATRGFEVGLLDVDICGPSVPRMMGVLDRRVHRSATGWTPVWKEGGLGIMSVGFMLDDLDAAVVWRGPKKDGLIKQFLMDVDWGSLDFLVIDTPPGTSDEHISTVQLVKGCASVHAVLVTTPQEVAMADVRKELNFTKLTDTHVLGLVENMSGYMCPCCGTVTDVFPAAGGGPKGMAGAFGTVLLGKLPLDPLLLRACESGTALEPASHAASAFGGIVNAILGQLGEPLDGPSAPEGS